MNEQSPKFLSFTIFTILLTFSLSMIFHNYISVQNAILRVSQKQLVNLLSVKDYPEASRQLNTLLGGRDFVGYRFFEGEDVRPRLKNIQEIEDSLSLNLTEKNQFDLYSFSIILRKLILVRSQIKGINGRLEIYSKLPLKPFVTVLLMLITIYIIYLYIIRIIKNDVKVQTSREIVHNVESRAKALFGVIKDMKSQGKLVDKNGIVEKLSQGIIDSLFVERRKHIFSSNKSKKTTYFEELIHYLIAYKRIELGNEDVEIMYSNHATKNAPFLNINPIHLDSILSNLINNSVDACTGTRAQIKIDFTIERNIASIKISDNGRGISLENQSRIFNKNFSDKDKTSTGIGLHHARVILEGVGGSIDLGHTSSLGSNFYLKIPVAHVPSWYVDLIDISDVDTIVIAGEEEVTHEECSIIFKRFKVKLIHFYDIHSMDKWLEDQKGLDKVLLFVDDYFAAEKGGGLDCIIQKGIEGKSILITRMAFDDKARDLCAKSNLKLIHRKYLSKIKFNHNSYVNKFKILKSDKVILLEDDDLLSIPWLDYAETMKIDLSIYNNSQKLEDSIHQYDPENTILFYDEKLRGENTTGSEINKNYLKMGFKNSFSISGYYNDDEIDSNHFLAVLGKRMPKQFFE